jgi:hypothetical protein
MKISVTLGLRFIVDSKLVIELAVTSLKTMLSFHGSSYKTMDSNE